MKNILSATVVLGTLALSSCYVGIEERHHRHHGASLEIHAANDVNQRDSMQSSFIGITNQNDSLQAPVKQGVIK